MISKMPFVWSLPLAFLASLATAQSSSSDNTTSCISACVGWEYRYDTCSWVDSTNDQSLSSCSCYGGSSSWRYYALLLGCTQCDADGLGNYPLNFYQQWTAICNVFMNEGNAAAQSLLSYAEGSAMTSAFSESILPALQSMGNDDGVQLAIPVTVNGTSTTIGGASAGSGGADVATTASPASIRSSSMPAATTASSTVASDTEEEDAASATVAPNSSSSDEAAASATESSSSSATGDAASVSSSDGAAASASESSSTGRCCTFKLDAPPPPRLHRSHSDPALPSHPLEPSWKQHQLQQADQELPFLRELHGSSRHKRFYRQLSSTSPATFVPAVLLLLVLILQLFLLPRLPPHLQLFRPPPPARPTSCPTVPAFNPFVQELYCRVPQHTPSALYRQSPHSMALAAAAERVAAEFEYTKQDVQKGVKEFMRQMDEGLNVQGATLSQIPTYVTAVPNGTEKGLYMAVDLGGTNFRVCSIQLHGNSTFSLTQSKVKIPNELMTAKTSHQLFSFLAKQIETFLKTHHGEHYQSHIEKRRQSSMLGGTKFTEEEIFSLGFTFSFPVQQYGINKGTLIRWTKGFDIPDAVGKDVCALLQKELDALHLPIRVAALVNDTVGTLMARSYTSPGKTGTLLGAIFGTGTNGAYVEKLDKIKKLAKMGKDAGEVNDSTGEMIVNTEWGSFDNHLSVLPVTSYDKSLDADSNNPGIQMFEKRVSGMFLGEILRRCIVDLINDKSVPLFKDEHSNQNDVHSTTNIHDQSSLYQQYGLDTSFLSITSGDNSAGLKVTRQSLDSEYGVSAASAEDAEAVRLIAAAIGKRAARLSAVPIAAVILATGKLDAPHDVATTEPGKQAGADLSGDVNEEDIIDIGVDGSLVEFYPNFEEYIREALREVPGIGPQGERRIRIGIAKDGSGVGAALIALVADRAMRADSPNDSAAGSVGSFFSSLIDNVNRNLKIRV
ncbi:putative glucokinase [Hortaea werneckii]|nr:putative glucokinase [Hortaea werneckii]KAI7354795.1 putative glucokinase [Hortaea werneckii]